MKLNKSGQYASNDITVGFPSISDKSNYTLSQYMYYIIPYSTYCARSISVFAIIDYL